MQNLKLDIIYHQTPSDFELEFNLCGCCRMRLLSDKTTDKKSFIKALARDVSRSRVIIVSGPLFNDDGLINLVTRAIGSTLYLCDNKAFGIKSNEPIHIISGSTPLVTPDGYFGGCIIESGPQTIVLLTENKAFRKAIMQSLIHPYIEEISYTPTKTTIVEPVQEPEEFTPATGEQEAYLTDVDDYDTEETEASELLAVPQSDSNIEFIMDDEEDIPTEETAENNPALQDEGYRLMYTEIESEKEIKARYQDPYVPSESDNMFLSSLELDDDITPDKNNAPSRKLDITIILLVMFLALAILALVYLIVLKPLTMGISVGDYVKEIFGIANHNTLI